MRIFSLILAVWATSALGTETLMDGTLKVTVSQGGFAGTTGTTYEVDPLANLVVSGFVNENMSGDSSVTALQNTDLDELQALLNQTFQSSVSDAPQVNPLTLSVEYQGSQWVVILPGGQQIAVDDDVDPEGSSVRNLVAWIISQAQDAP